MTKSRDSWDSSAKAVALQLTHIAPRHSKLACPNSGSDQREKTHAGQRVSIEVTFRGEASSASTKLKSKRRADELPLRARP